MSVPEALQSGARVFIRRPVLGDCDEYCMVRRRSRAFHEPWEPTPAAGFDPYSKEAFRHFVAGTDAPNRERFFVCRSDTGAIVGNINANEIVRGCFQSAFLGYWVDADAAGSGYMTEGLQLVLRHAFTVLDLHRLEANIQPHNHASIALVKRCGFVLEGRSPRYLKIGGVWSDHERFAITIEDWQANASA